MSFRLSRSSRFAPLVQSTSLSNIRLFIGLVVIQISVCFAPVLSFGWQTTSEPTTTERYQKYIDGIMKVADENQDGFIDLGEQKKYYRPIFKDADSDRDGLIAPKEILAKVSSGGETHDSENEINEPATTIDQITDAASLLQSDGWRVKTTVLRLPRSFAQKQVLSLDDIFRRMAVDQTNEHLEIAAKPSGISVLDQFELDVFKTSPAKLRIQGESVKSVRTTIKNGNIVKQKRNAPFGTLVTITPQVSPKDLSLLVDYRASYAIQENVTDQKDDERKLPEAGFAPVDLEVRSELRFTKKSATALSLYAAGHHFLFIVSLKPL